MICLKIFTRCTVHEQCAGGTKMQQDNIKMHLPEAEIKLS